MSTLAPSDRFEFAPPPTAGLGRSLVLAVLAHAVLLAALTWGVNWKSEPLTATAEAELWSALPQAAAPRLIEVPPEPAPEPLPAPPPPVVKAPTPPPPPKAEVQPTLPDPAIALEQEKRRLQKEKQQALDKLEQQKQAKLQQDKLKQDKLDREKAQREADKLQVKRQQDKEAKEAKDKQAADAKKLADSKKKAEQAAERKQAEQAAAETQKIEAQRQANLKRMAGLAGATGADTATGTALRSSGPSASYAGRIRASIKPNIILLDDIAGNPVAEVEVRTSPDGTIVNRKLLKSSGEKSWDDAVLKAIDKTATLPKDVDGRVPPLLVISFRPKD